MSNVEWDRIREFAQLVAIMGPAIIVDPKPQSEKPPRVVL